MKTSPKRGMRVTVPGERTPLVPNQRRTESRILKFSPKRNPKREAYIMTKLSDAGTLVAAVIALALFFGVAVAQRVTVFTGSVTINGGTAPAGTIVNVTL